MTAPPPALRYDLIVFDWDGTLFDSTASIVHAIQRAAADLEMPVPSDAEASYVIGLGLAEALRHAVPALPPARYPELADRYRHHFFQRHDEIVFFDGALTLLDALKTRGHRLAVATGKSRRGLDETLRRAGLHTLFDATRTADQTASKPDPTMLLELMDELEVAPDRTLMVGDTTHDLQLALNAGCAMLGVSYGAHDPASFAEFPVVHVAHDVADLSIWLARHG